MNIVISGCGKVGFTIAQLLSAESNINVTIIDNKPSAFEKAAESIDAMLVEGNGLNVKTLAHAGVKEADLLISVMHDDDTNILCCILAKRLGCANTAARVRNPEYALDLLRFWKDLGLDFIINPELATAREISRLLRFPTADDIDTFLSGRVELVSFKVSEAPEYFVGKSVSVVFSNKKLEILLAMVERNDTPIIPHGDLVFEAGDVIRILGRPSSIMSFFTLTGKNTDKIKNAVIIGASKITHYLIELLHRHSSGTGIKVIELKRERCEALSESFPRCIVIHGDGADEDLLNSEAIDRDGAIVCLTDRDEENTVIALYSQRLKFRKVITKIDHINPKFVKDLGIGSIVSPKNITSEQIIRHVRSLTSIDGSVIRTVHNIFDDGENRVEAIELIISWQAKYLDIPLKELKLKRGILIGCIVRNANIIIPNGDTAIQAGDVTIIIAKNESITDQDDIFAGMLS